MRNYRKLISNRDCFFSHYSLTISPHIRGIVYDTAIKYGGLEEWEFLWNKYLKTIDATEKSRMLYALSGSKEPWLLSRFVFSTVFNV